MHSGRLLFQPNPWEYPAYSVGIDASLTSLGVYCQPINCEEWFSFTVETGKDDGSDTTRAIAIAQTVIETLSYLPHPIAVVGFEDYGPISSRSGKITARAEICGILKAHFLQSIATPIIMLSPPSLKSFATGKGNCDKQAVMNAAAAEGFFATVSDEADAYFVARFAQRIILGDKQGVAYVRVNP